MFVLLFVCFLFGKSQQASWPTYMCSSISLQSRRSVEVTSFLYFLYFCTLFYFDKDN